MNDLTDPNDKLDENPDAKLISAITRINVIITNYIKNAIGNDAYNIYKSQSLLDDELEASISHETDQMLRRDMDAEIEQRTLDYINLGYSPEAARWEAQIYVRFGNFGELDDITISYLAADKRITLALEEAFNNEMFTERVDGIWFSEDLYTA